MNRSGGNDKPVVWLFGEVKTPPFGPAARIEAGVLLRRLQSGENLRPPQSRPMPAVGTGCHELRVIDQNVTWRIVYALEPQAIVILDVFGKKTRTTPKGVVDNCRRRLAAFRQAIGEESG